MDKNISKFSPFFDGKNDKYSRILKKHHKRGGSRVDAYHICLSSKLGMNLDPVQALNL